MTPDLSPPHRRSLSVTAQVVDQALAEIESVLRADQVGNRINSVTLSYSPSARHRLSQMAASARQQNLRMFRELDLQGQTTSERQIVEANAAYLWTILIDSRADKLIRYGSLSPESAREIDSHIASLLAMVESLLRTEGASSQENA
jgi:hypothetical protein